MDAVLTHYPLSKEFEARLKVLGKSEYLHLNLAELRQLSIFRILRHLRSLDIDNLYLPSEDDNDLVLQPVLKVISCFIPARNIFLVDQDMNKERVSWSSTIGALLRLIHASLVSAYSVRKANFEIVRLLGKPRILPAEVSGRNALYLNANLWFGVKAGGSVGHISGVINEFLNQQYSVDFVSAGGRLHVDEKASYTQLEPPQSFGYPWELNYYRFHFKVVKQVASLIRRKKMDFIYQRLSIANYSGVMLSRMFNLPLILEYNGSEAWVAKNWGRPLKKQQLAENIEKVNLRHAHLIVTVSEVLKDELLSRGVPKERIVCYPNGFDPEIFNPDRFSEIEISQLRKTYHIDNDATVVAFIGTFGQWHGAEVLASAIRNLIDEHLESVQKNKLHFLLVGDGLKLPEVKRILGQESNGPYVTLTGLVPQSSAAVHLAASDILVSPHVPNADGTKFFGSPTKLFEYMAMGKAIIASDLDQIGDVLAGGITVEDISEMDSIDEELSAPAVLCKPGDIAQLQAGLVFLAENAEWRKKLGSNARHKALNEFTWRNHLNEIIKGMKVLGSSSH